MRAASATIAAAIIAAAWAALTIAGAIDALIERTRHARRN